MRDVSQAGVELGRARLEGLPARTTLSALLRHRVEADVAAYNPEPGPVFAGLVQPGDAVRHSYGFRMPAPRPLDAGLLHAAAEEAVRTGLLRVRAGSSVLAELTAEVEVAAVDEVVAVLARPVVAREA